MTYKSFILIAYLGYGAEKAFTLSLCQWKIQVEDSECIGKIMSIYIIATTNILSLSYIEMGR